MSIRKMIRNLRENPPEPTGRDLVLTEAALEAIRSRLAGPEENLAFFVTTQPSPVGFTVGVGFRVRQPEDTLHPGLPVAVVVSEPDQHRLRGYTIDFREQRFVTYTDVTVHVKETPNPASRKFMVNRPLISEGSATFTRPAGEDAPILVKLLFEIPEVHSLFFINDFVSVTQGEGTVWDSFQTQVGQRIQAYFAHGGVALTPTPADPEQVGEVERKIQQVLEDVVRPAVQRDGGDIAFAGYEAGTVQLYMLGSCSGCPSAMATLKMGVENLLKDAVPEIREVVAID